MKIVTTTLPAADMFGKTINNITPLKFLSCSMPETLRPESLKNANKWHYSGYTTNFNVEKQLLR